MALPTFLDAEFSSLTDPHAWSFGLVTLDGRECYCELNPESEAGKTRWAQTPWDVREGVVDKFGLFPDSLCDSEWAMGRRVGEWLLKVADSSADGQVELLYDYDADLELVVGVLQECNLWPKVRLVASERNIGAETGSIGPELASEAAFSAMRRRQPALYRHHALADALALRAAWRTWHLAHERATDFLQMLRVVGDSQEGWLYQWLASPAPALGGLAPLDVLDQAGGLQVAVDALHRIEGGCA